MHYSVILSIRQTPFKIDQSFLGRYLESSLFIDKCASRFCSIRIFNFIAGVVFYDTLT